MATESSRKCIGCGGESCSHAIGCPDNQLSISIDALKHQIKSSPSKTVNGFRVRAIGDLITKYLQNNIHTAIEVVKKLLRIAESLPLLRSLPLLALALMVRLACNLVAAVASIEIYSARSPHDYARPSGCIHVQSIKYIAFN
jgi:hypothetical protein